MKSLDRIQSHKKLQLKNNDHQPPTSTDKCWNCGNNKHSRLECPAKDVKCQKCQVIGHFAEHCRKSKSNSSSQNQPDRGEKLNEITSSADIAYLGAIDDPKASKSWFTDIAIHGYDVHTKLDSGMDRTAMTDVLPNYPELVPSNRHLFLADGTQLVVKGIFKTSIRFKNRVTEEKVYVVPILKNTLLGREALQKLELVKLNLDTIEVAANDDEFICEYPSLF